MKRGKKFYLKAVLSICHFLYLQGTSLLHACEDEYGERSPSLGYCSADISPGLRPTPFFPSCLEQFLQEIPFLSKKENIHILSKQFIQIFNSNSSEFNDCSIVLGTGLKCLHAKSKGIPFDVLGFIATAVSVRNTFGFQRIIHYIGDNHAKSCGFGPENFSNEIDLFEEAQQQKLFYQKLAKKLGIEGIYSVILASEFHEEPQYQLIKQEVFSHLELVGETEYTKLEVADIEYFRRHCNSRVKFSWVMHEEKGKSAQRDECSYDLLYKRIFQEDMSFLYSKSGVNLSERRALSPMEIDSVPYSYPEGDIRITLKPFDKKVEEKLAIFLTFSNHKLLPREEERLKNKYKQEFRNLMNRKYSSHKKYLSVIEADLQVRMERDDTDLNETLSVIDIKILNERDALLAKYFAERIERLKAEQERFFLTAGKVKNKYQEIINSLLCTFPVIRNVVLSVDDTLEQKIQSVVDFVAREE